MNAGAMLATRLIGAAITALAVTGYAGADPAPADAPPAQAPAAEQHDTSNPTTTIAQGLTSILGKDVSATDSTGSIGKITDILVDESGKVQAAVIDVGGFLGVGSRKIAVEWPLLHFDPSDKKVSIVVQMDRAALQSAPRYGETKEPKRIVRAPADNTAPDQGGNATTGKPSDPVTGDTPVAPAGETPNPANGPDHPSASSTSGPGASKPDTPNPGTANTAPSTPADDPD